MCLLYTRFSRDPFYLSIGPPGKLTLLLLFPFYISKFENSRSFNILSKVTKVVKLTGYKLKFIQFSTKFWATLCHHLPPWVVRPTFHISGRKWFLGAKPGRHENSSHDTDTSTEPFLILLMQMSSQKMPVKTAVGHWQKSNYNDLMNTFMYTVVLLFPFLSLDEFRLCSQNLSGSFVS